MIQTDYLREPVGNAFNMAVDGSSSPVVFELRPQILASSSELYRAPVLVFQLVDNVAPFNPVGFGGLSTLPNGLLFQGRRDTAVRSLTGGVPVRTSADFALLGEIVNEQTDGGRTALSVTVESLKEITLRASANESIEVVVQDNLSSLIALRVLARYDRIVEPFEVPEE